MNEQTPEYATVARLPTSGEREGATVNPPKEAAAESAIAVVEQGAEVVSGLPYNYRIAIAECRKRWIDIKKYAMELGCYILAIKRHEPHGRYLEALNAIGINQRSALRFRNRAEFILAHQNQIGLLSDLAGTHIDLLRKLPDTTLEELTDEEGHIAGLTIDQARALTGDEFAEVLSQAQDAIDAANERAESAELTANAKDIALQAAEMEIKDLKDDLAAVQGAPQQWPNSIKRARLEGSALTDRAVAALDSLEALALALYQADDLTHDDPGIADTQTGAGVSTLYLNLRTIAAKTDRILAQVKAMYPPHMLPEDASGDQLMSEPEAVEIRKRRDVMLLEHRQLADAREVARMAEGVTKRGRGRPRKGQEPRRAQ